MKHLARGLFVLILLLPCLFSQTQPTTLTNEMIIRMVQSGIPSDVIIRTIAAAPSVDFKFGPYDLQALEQGKVSVEVVKVMAAKDKGLPLPGVQPQPPITAAPAPAVQTKQPPEGSAPKDNSRVPKATRNEDGVLGRVEILGFAGANGGPNRAPLPDASYSVGAEVAVGLLRNLSATGTYAFDSLGSVSVVSAHANEFMGGIRIPFPNSSVATPYLEGNLGGLNLAAGAFGVSVSTNKFAFAPGGGVNFKLARHLGFDIDFRAIKAVNVLGGLAWQYRATSGVSVRF